MASAQHSTPQAASVWRAPHRSRIAQQATTKLARPPQANYQIHTVRLAGLPPASGSAPRPRLVVTQIEPLLSLNEGSGSNIAAFRYACFGTRISDCVCWLFIFKVTEPNSIPYGTHSVINRYYFGMYKILLCAGVRVRRPFGARGMSLLALSLIL